MTGFIAYLFIYILNQLGCLWTVYYAMAAGLNIGVITAIWSVTPFFMALGDKIFYNTPLSTPNLIGMVFIVASTVILSLIKILDPEFAAQTDALKTQHIYLVETYIPVLFGVAVPLVMAGRVMLIKNLCSPIIGFKDNRLAFNSILVVNLVVLICVLPYWLGGHFDSRLFWIGFASSLFDTLGKVCLIGGVSNGPSGPVSALVALDGVETFLL